MVLNLVKTLSGHPALHRLCQAQSLALIRIYEETRGWLPYRHAAELADGPCRLHAFQARPRTTAARSAVSVSSRWCIARGGEPQHSGRLIKEMLHYNIAEYVSGGDGRTHPLQPTAATVKLLPAGSCPLCGLWISSTAGTGCQVPGAALRGLSSCSLLWGRPAFLQAGLANPPGPFPCSLMASQTECGIDLISLDRSRQPGRTTHPMARAATARRAMRQAAWRTAASQARQRGHQ